MEALDPTIETFVQESFQEIFNRIAPEEENSTAKTIHIAIKLFTSYSPQPIKIAASFDAKLLLTKNEDGDTILDTLVDNDNDSEADDCPKEIHRLDIMIQLFSNSKPELEFSRSFDFSACSMLQTTA